MLKYSTVTKKPSARILFCARIQRSNKERSGTKMKEIIELLPVLAVAVLMNICAGIYYNIGTGKMKFSLTVLLTGIIKALIVSGLFIGTAFCFEATDLSSIGVTPPFVMTSAVTVYVGKSLISLGRILGVEINTGKGRAG